MSKSNGPGTAAHQVGTVILPLSIQPKSAGVATRQTPKWPRLAFGLTLTAFLLATLPVAAQSIPKTEEVTLAGDQVNLESALRRNTGILILGFSKKSETQVRDWTKALLVEFSSDRSIVIFEMPILEGMPRLVRGMALRSMKNATSPAEREHFLPVFHNEMQWKQLAQFSPSDDAYIVVVDREGKIAWREHGPIDEKRKPELIGKVRASQSPGTEK